MASWEVGVEGLDWLEAVIAQGAAVKLQRGGCPNLYQTSAGPVLDMLQNGPPPVACGMPIIGDDYVMPAGWRDQVKLLIDRMGRCPNDYQLVSEAWDLS